MEETVQSVAQEGRYASRMPSRKYAYFRDDQITFLVAHSEDGVADQQLQDFASVINGKLESRHSRLSDALLGGIIEKTPEAISFPKFTDGEIQQNKDLLSSKERRRGSEAFSLIKCEVKGAPTNPAGLLRIVSDLNKQLSKNTRDKPESTTGLTIEGTSLNWLTSVASQAGGTGGPGGRPSHYYGSRKNAPYHFRA